MKSSKFRDFLDYMKSGKRKKRIRKTKKDYLKNKITATTILIWVLVGFIAGGLLGRMFFAESSKNHIPFTVVYSSEKASWMSEASILFADYWQEKMTLDSSLKPISIDMQPYGSGDMLIALLNQEIKPTIWSPASNIWVPILNAKWSQLSETGHLIAPNFTQIIYSPVVIATWENFLADNPFNNFTELHDLIDNNPGLVKLAHTDPRSSNSGFMATVMMVSAYLNATSTTTTANMTLGDLGNPDIQEWMRVIESAAILYGKSTGFLGKYMRDQGPEELQVTILYENVVQDYTLDAESKFGQKMVAVYPEEGVLLSDHPFCILDADWVSEEQKNVAKEFLNFISQKDLVIKAISTGFRPYNNTLLDDPDVQSVYNASFNAEHGVTSNATIIKNLELNPPSDGNVISRIPDLWLLTRNTV
ncbi:MAG: ABC transporter substrate-binding protein [Promethearchaeota archaeon]|nr:MAG: ABC transporter substrate-binding protein [Candidatus Lokiarchaeota archaeon]